MIEVLPGTLAAVLYSNVTEPLVAEKDWERLVQYVAAGDQSALRELFERMHTVVAALIERITGNRDAAKALTIDVFHDIWRRAPSYAAADGTVVGWIMGLARTRAVDRVRFEGRDGHGAESGAARPNAPPAPPSWERLIRRISPAGEPRTGLSAQHRWVEPQWTEVAPGITCKLLATDPRRDRVSMLVRLAPETDYPPHRHAGVEELHLLDGELWIDDRKLHPGSYNRAAPGTADLRVWSQTGCMCVLITSPKDELG